MENHNNNDLEDLNNLMQEQEQRRKELASFLLQSQFYEYSENPEIQQLEFL